MTEQTRAQEDEAAGVRVVPFMGRDFNAVLPTPEQILVWRRTMDRLGSATDEEVAGWGGEQALNALDRIRKIVDSVVSPADASWLDDQMLQRDSVTGGSRFTFQHAHELLLEVVKAFQINNREERRAAKVAPAAPARRKSPAKKTPGKASG